MTLLTVAYREKQDIFISSNDYKLPITGVK
jgi:hypothetical protein